ncbi:MAG: Ppx/GppA family phosphatase [Nitrospirae bacterium]|nr:Ppx/GppA family phosphatase [Nitrospirota bacterium]
MKDKALAAIDMGTNTFRLLIADVRFNPGRGAWSIREIFSERIITRLGGGLSRGGLLKREAMTRSLSALEKFASVLPQYDINKVSAVATSALREAGNSGEFLTKVKQSTGLSIRIISGEEEAKKTATGMLIGIKIPETALMVDIGGGSTELIFALRGRPLLVQSLKLGVVYLAGKYMRKDPPSMQDLGRMNDEIIREIMQAAGRFIKRLNDTSLFIGTAGTVTSLSAIAGGLTEFEHRKIHRSRLTREKVNNIYSDISRITARERGEFIPFESSRLDIIVPGTLILLRLMEIFGFREITVSNYGLREGILVDLCRKIMRQNEKKGP